MPRTYSSLCSQAAAQTDRQNALSKLAELEGVLQQALDQRVCASEEALRSQSHLAKKTSELNAAQQHLQRQQQELAALQVCMVTATVPFTEPVTGCVQ